MTVSTVTRVVCHVCGPIPGGDREAEKHTKATGHPTETITEPKR